MKRLLTSIMLYVFLMSAGVSAAGWLMTLPNDLAVIAGSVLIAAMFFLSFGFVQWTWTHIKKGLK